MEAQNDNPNSSQENISAVPENASNSKKKEKCPLCLGFCCQFICEMCIAKGDFKTATDVDGETFAAKKASLIELKNRQSAAVNMCQTFVAKKLSSAELPEEIDACQERIQILKALIKEKRETIQTHQTDIEKSQEKNKLRSAKMLQYKERVDRLQNIVQAAKAKNQDKKQKLDSLKLELKSVVKKNIKHLVQYVFPIEKVNPVTKSTDSESEIVSALVEASKTSLIRGAWVLMDSSTEIQHRIVAPSLPASGDYGAFMAVKIENGVPLTDQIGGNEAFNIGAALCYTTQLTLLLSFYLDIILPKKVSFADFCSKELTERQFRRKVANLNTNVLYLCFSQGMDSILLNPHHTLNNLLNLVEYADLGRTEPFYVDAGLTLGLECLEGDDGSDQEDGGEGFPWEWEAIPLVACTEGMNMNVMSSTQANTSIANELVSSVAAFFRGWTSGK